MIDIFNNFYKGKRGLSLVTQASRVLGLPFGFMNSVQRL